MLKQKNIFREILLLGLVTAIPLMFVAYLIITIIEMISKVIQPITLLLPPESIFGIGTPTLAAVTILLIFVILLGFATKKEIGGKVSGKIDFIIPGFSILKDYITGNLNQNTSHIKPCLATLDDAWLFAFIVEEHESGMLSVFIPSAPSITSGSLYFLTEQQVKRLNMSNREAAKCIIQYGSGAKAFLDKEVKW